MNEIKLIASDLDGCLVEKGVFDPNRPAVMEIKEYCSLARGGMRGLPPLVLCTGRSSTFVDRVIYILGAFFSGCPSVIEGGGGIYFSILQESVYDGLANANFSVIAHMREILKHDRIVGPLLDGDSSKKACITIKPGSSGFSINEVVDLVKNSLGELLKGFSVVGSSTAIDIIPVGIDKLSGLKMIVDCVNPPVSIDEILGIGDSDNDIPVMEVVGVPCCPDNANERVKEIVNRRGGYVASKPYAEGVLEIIKKFVWK